MDSLKSIFSFSVEGLLSAIALLLWVLIEEIKGLRRQIKKSIEIQEECLAYLKIIILSKKN